MSICSCRTMGHGKRKNRFFLHALRHAIARRGKVPPPILISNFTPLRSSSKKGRRFMFFDPPSTMEEKKLSIRHCCQQWWGVNGAWSDQWKDMMGTRHPFFCLLLFYFPLQPPGGTMSTTAQRLFLHDHGPQNICFVCFCCFGHCAPILLG